MSTYPQHEKLAEVKDQSQAIGVFLEFSGYRLCTVEEHVVDESRCLSQEHYRSTGWLHDWHPSEDCLDCDGKDWIQEKAVGLVETAKSIQEILAEHFGIDYTALMAEKDAMLEACRSNNKEEVPSG